ncbi:MAG TPA: hypothetical protein VGD98_18680 [Ktedonobacteraceae bacterium]
MSALPSGIEWLHPLNSSTGLIDCPRCFANEVGLVCRQLWRLRGSTARNKGTNQGNQQAEYNWYQEPDDYQFF